jgi:hypothetical protein
MYYPQSLCTLTPSFFLQLIRIICGVVLSSFDWTFENLHLGLNQKASPSFVFVYLVGKGWSTDGPAGYHLRFMSDVNQETTPLHLGVILTRLASVS